MKQLFTVTMFVLLFIATSTFASVQKKQAPQFQLIEFHMALLKRGPKWTGAETAYAKNLEVEVRAYGDSLVESGKAVLAGRLDDDGEIRGVYVFRAKSADEAKIWAESDPGVKAGYLIAEMHPWWSEDVMKKAVVPIKLTKAYLGFLTRGPKWTPEKTPKRAEIQKAHLANINKLAEMKKLVVAGPFGDNGELRGIFVFKVASLEEAKALAETDPAVQAGQLAIDMHPWLVPEGTLP
jgi:uncharacterized protein YciI